MFIQGKNLSIDDLYTWSHTNWSETREDKKLKIHPEAQEKMSRSRSYIEGRISSGEVMYGVNTGFGAFSNIRISDKEIETLQRNLIRSHSAGVGDFFSKEQSRAIMLLRANALATGFSGIRPVVVEKILEFLNADIIPVIPSQGSVGASGDLAPLSHLALSLIGEGEVWDEVNRPVPASLLLQKKGIKPLVLKAKEGLSLINGCQVMTAVGMLSCFEAKDLLVLADFSGALSLEALRGSRKPFDPIISATRPHLGEGKTARNLMKILSSTSEIAESHIGCEKVQDAYSLRTMPAVHGSVKDTLNYVISVLETEANSATDNPLVFADENKILSCGNFHGMPVAFVMDFLGIALSSQASICERRMASLMTPFMSQLPMFLAKDGGLQSGHMIVQYAAASLVSENKVLAHPACVDTIPTSAGKEDHVSMGTIAARKAHQILKNVQNVVAMEILSACQGLDLLAPLKSSPVIEQMKKFVREYVPFAEQDRVFSRDIHSVLNLIKDRKLVKNLTSEIKDLEV